MGKVEDLGRVRDLADRVRANVERVIVGKGDVIDLVLVALLCEGHILLEDVPGIGKTMLAKSVARSLGCTFRRIQFTPDLLPSDVTGVSFFNQKRQEFEFRPGPVFSQVLLADEINRATPRTQSALLECMEERQVTLEGETFPLPQPFMVLATQNPIEYEGTFPLPEAQVDRFMMRVAIGYPGREEELEILKRRWERQTDEIRLQSIADAQELKAMRQVVESVYVEPDVARYMVALVQATRTAPHVAVGASPRASLALLKLSRARAAMEGRDYVIPDDVKFVMREVFIHRLILKPDMWAVDLDIQDVVEAIVRSVPVPKVDES